MAETEAAVAPRWVWSDAPAWYAALLAAGVRVARCHDLRLCHAILRASALVDRAAALRAARRVGCRIRGRAPEAGLPRSSTGTMTARPTRGGPPAGLDGRAGRSSRGSARRSRHPRIRAGCACSIAAESAGALIAEELRAAGLPWDAAAHDRILVDTLGERPRGRRRAGEARRGRGARARRAGRSRARASTRSRSCCARFTAPACSSSRRADGSWPSSSIRSSSRCSSTRSSRACSRRTAGRGSRSGCTTGGSGPCTCRAAS